MKSKLVKVNYSYYTPKGYNKHNYDYGIGVSEMRAIDAVKKVIKQRLRHENYKVLKMEFVRWQ